MASGHALRMFGGAPVVIGRGPERPVHSPMFENIPWINGPNPVHFLMSHTGRRNYIEYGKGRNGQQVLKQDHRPAPGVLEFTEDEVGQAAALMGCEHAVVVEPHVKGTFSGENKRWPWINWEEVVLVLKKKGKRVVQVSAPGTPTLPGVDFRVSESNIRVALACLAWAAPLVTTDGLLHHAAAAMGVPAVVIWGSRTDPRILGYPDHVNLSAGPPYCGMRTECEHCKQAMWSIYPSHVLEAVFK